MFQPAGSRCFSSLVYPIKLSSYQVLKLSCYATINLCNQAKDVCNRWHPYIKHLNILRWHLYIPPFGFSRCAVCTCKVRYIFYLAVGDDDDYSGDDVEWVVSI